MNVLLWCLFRAPLLLSWLTSFAVTAVLLSPCVIAMKLINAHRPLIRHATVGAMFGLVVIPLSFWLYLHFFVGPLRGLILGFPGLFMLFFHLSVFRSASLASHDMVMNPAAGFVTGLVGTTCVELLFWVICYSLLGLLVGWFRRGWRPSVEGA